MVIQWNEGPTHHSLAWGYGWNSGTRTGWDMLTAIDLIDIRLSLDINAGSVFGLFYDLDGDGGTYTPGTPGVYSVTSDTAGSVSDPGDLYQSGWVSAGYWEYSVFGGNFNYDVYDLNPPFDYLGSSSYSVSGNPSYGSVAWFSSPLGSSARELVNGSWDAYSFAESFGPVGIEQPLTASVPEPAIFSLLIFSLGVVFHVRRKRLHSH